MSTDPTVDTTTAAVVREGVTYEKFVGWIRFQAKNFPWSIAGFCKEQSRCALAKYCYTHLMLSNPTVLYRYIALETNTGTIEQGTLVIEYDEPFSIKRNHVAIDDIRLARLLYRFDRLGQRGKPIILLEMEQLIDQLEQQYPIS